MVKRVLVAGGSGFVGSHLCRMLLAERIEVVSVDLEASRGDRAGYSFHQVDITDRARIASVCRAAQPDAVVNCATVPRQLEHAQLLRTHIIGVGALLDAAIAANEHVRFLHVSTGECLGSLIDGEDPFAEDVSPRPSTPYGVSRASGDLLAQSYHQMYGTDVVVTRCSSSYGSLQRPERFVPRSIQRLLKSQPVQLHGRGQHVRDWIHVQDHCRGIVAVLRRGRAGHVYHLGGDTERSSLQIAHVLCDITGQPRTQVEFIPDRPGNDYRYAMDFRKARHELGWFPQEALRAGLEQTVNWYREHPDWWTP